MDVLDNQEEEKGGAGHNKKQPNSPTPTPTPPPPPPPPMQHPFVAEPQPQQKSSQSFPSQMHPPSFQPQIPLNQHQIPQPPRTNMINVQQNEYPSQKEYP